MEERAFGDAVVMAYGSSSGGTASFCHCEWSDVELWRKEGRRKSDAHCRWNLGKQARSELRLLLVSAV